MEIVILNAAVINSGDIRVFFSGPVDVADFDPTQFLDDENGNPASTVVQDGPYALIYSNPDFWQLSVHQGDNWTYTDIVDNVQTPQTGELTSSVPVFGNIVLNVESLTDIRKNIVADIAYLSIAKKNSLIDIDYLFSIGKLNYLNIAFINLLRLSSILNVDFTTIIQKIYNLNIDWMNITVIIISEAVLDVDWDIIVHRYKHYKSITSSRDNTSILIKREGSAVTVFKPKRS